MGLRAICAGRIPAGDLWRIPDRFDLIGDIAVLSVPQDLAAYLPVVAAAVIASRKSVAIVLNRAGRIGTDDRTAPYAFVTGDRTTTTHREYGFSYRLDLARVFFAPRMAGERRRVTEQVMAGESVLIPFCGAGPFVIPAAARGARITAIEQNPAACRYLRENLALNGVADQVTAVGGDAFDPRNLPSGPFDRAIIPTPYGRDEILRIIAPLVRHGGMVHFYTFNNSRGAGRLRDELRIRGFTVRKQRRCGNVAPSVYRWVFDLEKE